MWAAGAIFYGEKSGLAQEGSVPASLLQCHVVGSINPAATRSAQSLAISSTAARRPFALSAGVVSPFGLTE